MAILSTRPFQSHKTRLTSEEKEQKRIEKLNKAKEKYKARQERMSIPRGEKVVLSTALATELTRAQLNYTDYRKEGNRELSQSEFVCLWLLRRKMTQEELLMMLGINEESLERRCKKVLGCMDERTLMFLMKFERLSPSNGR